MPRAVRRFGVALLLLVAIAAVPIPGVASDTTVDEIVVKFRDEVVAPDESAMPVVLQQQLSASLGVPFTVGSRTFDGAFKVALDPVLDLDQARAALNRVRLERNVLYASIAPKPVAITDRIRAKARVLSPPTDRLIVKYKDPVRLAGILAGFPPDRAELARLAASAGAPIGFLRAMHDGAAVVRTLRRLPIDVVEAMAARIALQPDVLWAQPDYINEVSLTPNDACYATASVAACNSGFQWDLFDPVGGINAPTAWDITTGSSSIYVAVIDTGALFAHPDLSGRLVTGYDTISDYLTANDGDPVQPGGCNPMGVLGNPFAPPCISSRETNAADPGDWLDTVTDQMYDSNSWFWVGFCGDPFPATSFPSSWHGSHVSGTIGAAANNSTGIAGINWVSMIQPIRALGKCGGFTSDIADGITIASGGTVAGFAANPTAARVLNMSLGGFRSNQTCDAASQTAINGALSRNAVVAVAAGNGNYTAAYDSPANCSGVITTAATGEKGYKAYYSNFGALVEIAAPGGDFRFHATHNPNQRGILSALNSGTTVPATHNYVQYQGTSMATPHAAGVASLMLSANSALTPSQVLSKMQTSARTFPTGAPACSTANDPVFNPVPSGSWFTCTCTTALCGAGLLDAYRAVSVAIGKSTTTGMASTTNPAPPGNSVTFTATVLGIVPSGNVSFMDGVSTIGGCASVALTGTGDTRTANCSTSALIAGAHTIVANYLGDSNNLTSASPPYGQSISTGSWLGYLYGGNQAIGTNSGVAAGSGNIGSGFGSFVGAGTANQANGTSSLVIGGFDNRAVAIDSLVGAGAGNRATGARTVIVGGGYNLGSGSFAFIGGGGRDGVVSTAAGTTILDHIAAAKWATIGGGVGNRAGNSPAQTSATVAGGDKNQALNTNATVGGGTLNLANALASTIAGGQSNSTGASATAASVGGGQSNSATGIAAMVPGGDSNLASGNYSFAAGRRAKTQTAAAVIHNGAFVFADSSNFDFRSAASNEFAVRASGGARIVSAIDGAGLPTAGVSLAAGSGTWASLSDRAAKQDLTAVDAQAVLTKVAALPLYTWRYRSETSDALHLGPTAQDFRASFGLGDSDTTITTVDADGVALTAVQALRARLHAKEAQIARQAQRLAALRQRIASLEAMQPELVLLKDLVAELSIDTPAPSRTRHPSP